MLWRRQVRLQSTNLMVMEPPCEPLSSGQMEQTPARKLASTPHVPTACSSPLLSRQLYTQAATCAAGGEITDLLSFYTLPSTVLGNDKYDTLKAAFQYYTVPGATPVQQLMTDALILAHNR